MAVVFEEFEGEKRSHKRQKLDENHHQEDVSEDIIKAENLLYDSIERDSVDEFNILFPVIKDVLSEHFFLQVTSMVSVKDIDPERNTKKISMYKMLFNESGLFKKYFIAYSKCLSEREHKGEFGSLINESIDCNNVEALEMFLKLGWNPNSVAYTYRNEHVITLARYALLRKSYDCFFLLLKSNALVRYEIGNIKKISKKNLKKINAVLSSEPPSSSNTKAFEQPRDEVSDESVEAFEQPRDEVSDERVEAFEQPRDEVSDERAEAFELQIYQEISEALEDVDFFEELRSQFPKEHFDTTIFSHLCLICKLDNKKEKIEIFKALLSYCNLFEIVEAISFMSCFENVCMKILLSTTQPGITCISNGENFNNTVISKSNFKKSENFSMGLLMVHPKQIDCEYTHILLDCFVKKYEQSTEQDIDFILEAFDERIKRIVPFDEYIIDEKLIYQQASLFLMLQKKTLSIRDTLRILTIVYEMGNHEGYYSNEKYFWAYLIVQYSKFRDDLRQYPICEEIQANISRESLNDEQLAFCKSYEEASFEQASSKSLLTQYDQTRNNQNVVQTDQKGIHESESELELEPEQKNKPKH